jgi:hypothetical protein
MKIPTCVFVEETVANGSTARFAIALVASHYNHLITFR